MLEPRPDIARGCIGDLLDGVSSLVRAIGPHTRRFPVLTLGVTICGSFPDAGERGLEDAVGSHRRLGWLEGARQPDDPAAVKKVLHRLDAALNRLPALIAGRNVRGRVSRCASRH